MPIYEYACPDCGHTYDHMQKLADAPIAACPQCGSGKYYKKISAAGFALKGSGWYVTDFRDGNNGKKPPEKKDGDGKPAIDAKPAETSATPVSAASSDSSSSASAVPAAAPAPAPAATPSTPPG